MIILVDNSDIDYIHDTGMLASTAEASENAVAHVLEAPVTDDGRSNFEWIRLANGDLILGVFPRGETYFAVEREVEWDFKRAEATNDIP